MDKISFETIDDYIATYSSDVQEILQDVRAAITEAAPNAVEKISYQMPTFYLFGNLVHFAAFKNHIGFYALPSGNEEFQLELSKYKTGKGSVQFPIDEPMPLALIKEIVRFRIKENTDRQRSKAKK